MKINKKLTPFNFSNANNTFRIQYIVIHYFGSLASASNLAAYWKGKYVGASAHYVVGHAGDIYQCVEDADVAWHCGSKTYKHPECRNSNSIGIEMAVKKKSIKTLSAADKDWYFEAATVAATVELVKELMQKYNVPEERVIRHYDVTGKTCPNPYVYDSTEHTWKEFRKAISAKEDGAELQPPQIQQPKPPVTPPAQIPSGSGNLPYKIVLCNCQELNIRPQPNTKLKEVGSIQDKKQYTIVEEKSGWGRLKSGAGWIKLSYTKRVL